MFRYWTFCNRKSTALQGRRTNFTAEVWVGYQSRDEDMVVDVEEFLEPLVAVSPGDYVDPRVDLGAPTLPKKVAMCRAMLSSWLLLCVT